MNKSLSNGKYISYNPAFKDIGESREKEGKQGGYARQTVHLFYIKLHSCSIDVLIEADYCQISSSTMCLIPVNTTAPDECRQVFEDTKMVE